jgi:hypothetical protein
MHRDDTRLRQGYGEAGTMAHAAQLIVDGQPRSTAVK